MDKFYRKVHWIKKGTFSRRVFSILMALAMIISLLPLNAMEVKAAEGTQPSVTAYATKDQLMTEFTPNNFGTAKTVGKLVFGKNSSGDPQEWYILGKDNYVSEYNTIIFAASPIATNREFNSDTSDKTYDSTTVYANHYGASDLRGALQNMATYTSYFTSAEQGLMNATTVTTNDTKNGGTYTTTDKLYALAADSCGFMYTTIKAGTNNQTVLAMNSYCKSGDEFWLRLPYVNNGNTALVACPRSYVDSLNVILGRAVQPASNLNLSSVLFASSAQAASSDTKSEKITDSTAMTLRLDGTGKDIGTVTYNTTTGDIKAVKGSTSQTVALVVQGNDGTNDWYYSKQITGTETVNVSDIKTALGSSADIDLSACKIWLETTDTTDGMIYAGNATEDTATNDIITDLDFTVDYSKFDAITSDTTYGELLDMITENFTGSYSPELESVELWPGEIYINDNYAGHNEYSEVDLDAPVEFESHVNIYCGIYSTQEKKIFNFPNSYPTIKLNGSAVTDYSKHDGAGLFGDNLWYAAYNSEKTVALMYNTDSRSSDGTPNEWADFLIDLGTISDIQAAVNAANPSSAEYTITATAGENGSISPSGAVKVTKGKNQTFTITPNAGYEIDTLKVDGKAVTASTSYTFSNVTAAHTIAVTFKAKSVTPTPEPDPTPTPDPTPDEGDTEKDNIVNDTKPADNAFNTNLSETPSELKDKVLTDEEKAKVAAGESASVYLEVVDISKKVSDTDKTLVESAKGASTIGMYIDISLYAKVGTSEPRKVTNTSGTVTITVQIPETLINTDSKVSRAYQIVRVHDGIPSVITCTYDETAKTISFETDAFSTYALAYSDTVKNVSGDGTGNGTSNNTNNNASNSTNNNVSNNTNSTANATPTNTENKDTSPKTGDNTPIGWLFALVLVSASGMIVVGKKRKYI